MAETTQTKPLYMIADAADILRKSDSADYDFVMRALYESDIPGEKIAASRFSSAYIALRAAETMVAWLNNNEHPPADEDELEPEEPIPSTEQYLRLLSGAKAKRDDARRRFLEAAAQVRQIGDALIAAHPGSEAIIVDGSPA